MSKDDGENTNDALSCWPDIVYFNAYIKSSTQRDCLFVIANFPEQLFTYKSPGTVYVFVKRAEAMFNTTECLLSDHNRFNHAVDLRDDRGVSLTEKFGKVEEISAGLAPTMGVGGKSMKSEETEVASKRQLYGVKSRMEIKADFSKVDFRNKGASINGVTVNSNDEIRTSLEERPFNSLGEKP